MHYCTILLYTSQYIPWFVCMVVYQKMQDALRIKEICTYIEKKTLTLLLNLLDFFHDSLTKFHGNTVG